MYFSLLSVPLLLSLAAAQTTISGSSVSSTACAAQPVMDACYASTSAIAQACATTDYGCLCSKWNDVLTCFQQCPNDPRYAATLSSHETYCNDNVAYGTSTSSAISRSVSAAPSATTSGSSGAQATDSSGGVRAASSTTGTSTGASSTSTAKSGAEGLLVGAGSVLMGVAGFVGAFL